MREVIITTILYGFDQKALLLRGALGSRSIFGTGTRYDLESLHKCGKRVETES